MIIDNILPPLFCVTLCLSLVLTTGLLKAQQSYLEQKMLDRAINNANDAAMLDARESFRSDEYGIIDIEPERLWQTYKRVLLHGMNQYNVENMSGIDAISPATLIAVDDGMYIRMYTEGHDGMSITRFSQKIPYARKYENNFIADTLSGNNIKIVYSSGIVQNLKKGDLTANENTIHSPLEIKLQILDTYQYLLDTYSARYNSSVDKSGLQIGTDTSKRISGVKNMLFMNTLVDWNYGTINPITNLSISTTQIGKARKVYCFTLWDEEDGEEKKYYASVFKEEDIPVGAENLTIAQSARVAADAGFRPYIEIEFK